MDFGKLAEVSVGLASAIGVLWIVLQILKVLSRRGSERPSESVNTQIAVLRQRLDTLDTTVKRHQELVELLPDVKRIIDIAEQLSQRVLNLERRRR